jgi:hypothetical protein
MPGLRNCNTGMVAVTLCRACVMALTVVLVDTAAQVTQIDIGPTYVLTGGATAGASDGSLSTARYNYPMGIYVTPFDDSILLVADQYNHMVRKVDLRQRTATTWLGVAGGAGDILGTGSAARLNHPTALKTDPRDPRFLFLTVYAGIRRVNVETAAMQIFSGKTNTIGDVEGSAASAQFHLPFGLAFIPITFNLVVADSYNYKLRQVSIIDGSTSLVAGDSARQAPLDGVGSAAGFGLPLDVVFYPHDPNSVLVTDYDGNCLRQLQLATRAVTSLTACSPTGGYQDGPLAAAKFDFPYLLATQAPMRYVYLAESHGNRVRRVDLEVGWVVTCVAGGGISPSPSSLQTALTTPTGITFGCRGGTLSMYITGLHSITVVDMANSSGTGNCRPTSLNIGPVSLEAGNGAISRSADGTGPSAGFDMPQSMLTSHDRSTLFVADLNNHAVRRIDMRTHRVSTWVGLLGVSGRSDGIGAAARMNQPRDLIHHPTDPRLLVMLEATMLRTIVLDTAEVRHLCGDTVSGYVEGSATGARFQEPYSLVAHPDGARVIVADTHNHRVRLVSLKTGATQLLAGSGASASTDGVGIGAAFTEPLGLAFTTAEPQELVIGQHGDQGACLRALDVGTTQVATLSPCGPPAYRDGPLQTALFSQLYGLSSSPTEAAAVFVADLRGSIRRADLEARWVMTVVGMNGASWVPSATSSLAASLNLPLRTMLACTPTGSLAMYISFFHSVARVDVAEGGCTATATGSSALTGSTTPSATATKSASPSKATVTATLSKNTASLTRTVSSTVSSSMTRNSVRTDTPSSSARRTGTLTLSTTFFTTTITATRTRTRSWTRRPSVTGTHTRQASLTFPTTDTRTVVTFSRSTSDATSSLSRTASAVTEVTTLATATTATATTATATLSLTEAPQPSAVATAQPALPIPVTAATAATSSAAVTAVAGSFASPAAALQVARAVGVLAVLRGCGGAPVAFDESLEFPRSMLPFVKVGSSDGAARRGAIIAFIICLTATTLAGLSFGLWRGRRSADGSAVPSGDKSTPLLPHDAADVQNSAPARQPHPIAKALRVARMPGLVAVVAMIGLDGLASSLVVLLVRRVSPALDVALAVVAALSCLGTVGFVEYAVRRARVAPCAPESAIQFVPTAVRRSNHASPDLATNGAVPAPSLAVRLANTQAARWAVFGSWGWADLSEPKSAESSDRLVTLGPVFSKYRAHPARPSDGAIACSWHARFLSAVPPRFLMLDATVTVCAAVFESVAVAVDCRSGILGLAAINCLCLVLTVAFRPFSVPLKNALSALLNLLTASSAVLAAAAELASGPGTTAEASRHAAASLAAAAALVSLCAPLMFFVRFFWLRLFGLTVVPDMCQLAFLQRAQDPELHRLAAAGGPEMAAGASPASDQSASREDHHHALSSFNLPADLPQVTDLDDLIEQHSRARPRDEADDTTHSFLSSAPLRISRTVEGQRRFDELDELLNGTLSAHARHCRGSDPSVTQAHRAATTPTAPAFDFDFL